MRASILVSRLQLLCTIPFASFLLSPHSETCCGCLLRSSWMPYVLIACHNPLCQMQSKDTEVCCNRFRCVLCTSLISGSSQITDLLCFILLEIPPISLQALLRSHLQCVGECFPGALNELILLSLLH